MTDAGGGTRAAGGGDGAAAQLAGSFGPNAWLVDDMYDRFLVDPSSVAESWREFFSDYRPAPVPATAGSGLPWPTPAPSPDALPAPGSTAAAATATAWPPSPVAAAPAGPVSGTPAAVGPAGSGPAVPPTPGPQAPPRPDGGAPTGNGSAPGDVAVPLRGAAARIVANMEASLGVPTATSVRTVPAKLLEVNRQILNNQLARTTGAKVSFTHLIGYAVVRALGQVPALNASYVPEVDGGGTRVWSAMPTSGWGWPSTSRRPTAPAPCSSRA